MKKIIVIGAGLGGLAVACRLAKCGFSVTVLEKNESLGGKVNYVEAQGFKFDTGASLLTMKHVFEELFRFCGRRLEDFLTLVRVKPICRYFWADGTQFDASDNLEKTEKQIAGIESRDVESFRAFLADSRRKYEVAERTFLKHSLSNLTNLIKFGHLNDIWTISALRSLDSLVKSYFKSPKLRQLFNRYATYNGSSPYQTPATFSLISYVEFGLGTWYPIGGIYEIPKALAKLGAELGVEFRTGCEVAKILTEHERAKGVLLKNGETLAGDIVIANSDAIETYRNLIDKKARKVFTDRRLNKIEPSCSGFVLLLGTNKKFDRLAHHNIFFSDNYKAEFDSIFRDLRPAANPTIYVCATSRTDESQAPKNCENLFVLINAPYTSSQTNWEIEAKGYRDLIIEKLEKFGLDGLKESVIFEQIITPEDFERKYHANRGSIYGVSSNGIFSAFLRPSNKAKDIENLYFVGGTTHPGGGMPLVLLSGKMVCDLITNAKSCDFSDKYEFD